MVLMTKVVNRITFMDCGSLPPNKARKLLRTQDGDPQQAVDRKAAAGCRSPKEGISPGSIAVG
jgi:hypothetical protein